MTYLVDPCGADGPHAGPPRDATFVLVGCGGTGGFLAEALCRLLLGRRGALHLVDPDRVEEQNVARQSFDRADVGLFKAEVLARRLARRFGRVVGYSVLPYDAKLHAALFEQAGDCLRLVVGCVDNSAARRAIAETLATGSHVYPYRTGRSWWLDCGNGRNAGQVLLGTATRPEALRGAFDRAHGVCRALPAPSLQRPDLLQARPEPVRLDCAEAVAAEQQGPTINQVVAAVAASFAEKLLAGTCAWSSAYFDLDDGTLRCVPADPRDAAVAAGLPVGVVAPPTRRAA